MQHIIKAYRLDRRLTQDDLASLLGVTQGLITQWERERLPISPRMAVRLEKITQGKLPRHKLRPDLFA
jgi:DNA-binding transcriptional regulator YdaS (Cro superfamily)